MSAPQASAASVTYNSSLHPLNQRIRISPQRPARIASSCRVPWPNGRPRTGSALTPVSSDIRLPVSVFRHGGGERDRTDDLLLAKQALSQLSYTPVPGISNQGSVIGTAVARAQPTRHATAQMPSVLITDN